MIRQRHIAVGKQLVDIPSYMVRVSSEQHIQIAPNSVFKTNALGRVKRKKAGAAKRNAEWDWCVSVNHKFEFYALNRCD